MSNIFNNIRLTRNNILVKESVQSLMLGESNDSHPANTGVVLIAASTANVKEYSFLGMLEFTSI